MVLSLLLSGSVRFFLPLPCTISHDQAQQTRSSTSMPHFRTTSTNFMSSTEGTYSLISPQQLSSCSQQAFLPNTVAGKSIKCPHTHHRICPTMEMVLKASEQCIHFFLHVTMCFIRTGLSQQWVTQCSHSHNSHYLSLSTVVLASRFKCGQEIFFFFFPNEKKLLKKSKQMNKR